MIKECEENKELKSYKMCSMVMVVAYIIVTFVDLIRDSLSAQAIIIFSVYMFTDSIIDFFYEHKVKKLFFAIVMLAIFFFFVVEYLMTVLGHF